VIFRQENLSLATRQREMFYEQMINKWDSVNFILKQVEHCMQHDLDVGHEKIKAEIQLLRDGKDEDIGLDEQLKQFRHKTFIETMHHTNYGMIFGVILLIFILGSAVAWKYYKIRICNKKATNRGVEIKSRIRRVITLDKAEKSGKVAEEVIEV
jgi:hypothetical protein